MNDFTYINAIPYALTSVCGVLALLHMGQWLCDRSHLMVTSFLIYVGGYTFNVLTWHFLSMKLVSLLLIIGYGLSIDRLADFPVMEDYATKGWWVIYSIVGVSLPVAGTYLFHQLKSRIKRS